MPDPAPDDPPYRNRAGMVPRYPTREGMLLRRSHFLDADPTIDDPTRKKLVCAFGPKQPPDCVEGHGRYREPLDWAPAGFLLRPIQVVWITVNFGSVGESRFNEIPEFRQDHPLQFFVVWAIDASAQERSWFTGRVIPPSFGLGGGDVHCSEDDFIADGAGANNNAGGIYSTGGGAYDLALGDTDIIYGDATDTSCAVEVSRIVRTVLVGDGPPDPDSDAVVNYYNHAIPNPRQLEFDRLRDLVIPDVLARFSDLRRGRTWGDWVRWFEPRFGANNYWVDIGDDKPEPTPAWSFHICPVPDQFPAEFYGTDFLHIHIGNPVGPQPNFDEDAGLTGAAGLPAVNLAALPRYQEGKARLQAQRQKFARYHVKMYGAAFDWEDFPPFPRFPFVSEKPAVRLRAQGPGFTNVDYDPWVEQGAGTPYYGFDNFFEGFLAEQSDLIAAAVDDFGSTKARQEQQYDAWIASICADMNAAEAPGTKEEDKLFQAMGNIRGLAAGQLWQVIADHFRFDAQTGDDLPPPAPPPEG